MIELFAATSRINGCQPLTLLGALSALGLMAFIGGVVWTGGALWFGDKDGMTPRPGIAASAGGAAAFVAAWLLSGDFPNIGWMADHYPTC